MRKKSGYTLIEVLIALAVFAIMATITAMVMFQVFDTRERINLQANQLNQVQLAILRVEQDTRQIISRAIRGKDMQLLSPFTGQHQYVEFTRDGIVNPLGRASDSSLRRVAYLCDRNRLVRRTWRNLDTPNRAQHQDFVILDGLTNCSFNYLSKYNESLPDWRIFKIEGRQKIITAPKAIELTINPYNWGDMRLLFILTEGLYAPS